MAEPYRGQVRLLLDILQLVMAEPVFALKGGTAINLFEWDLPRLSGRQLKVLARRFRCGLCLARGSVIIIKRGMDLHRL